VSTPTRPPQARQGGFRTAFEPLSIPAFRWLFSSGMAFFLAMGGQMLVRPYLAYRLTESEFALGVVTAAMATPMLLLSPFGGVLADRRERRGLIVFAQLASFVGEFGILLLLVSGRLEYWHLVVSTFLMGCTFPISMPARNAMVVNIVGKEGLVSAVALNMGMQNMMRVVGPALAGFLIPFVEIEGVYAFNTALYLVAVMATLRLPRFKPHKSTRNTPVLESLVGGFRYVVSNRVVGFLLLYGLVPMSLATPFQNLGVVFTEEVWHAGTEGLGILNAVIGVGGVAGTVVVAIRAPGAGRQRMMTGSALLFGGTLALAAFSPWFLPALALVFIGHACSAVFTALNNTAIQILIPDEVRGRVSSLMMMSFSLPMFGTLPVSAAAEAYGAPLAVGVSCALGVVFALIFYTMSQDLRNLDARVASTRLV
jgi:MFS family permease